MAKKVENYNEVEFEQDSLRMMAHINSMNDKNAAAEEDGIRKQIEDREKTRLNALSQYVIRSVADVVIFIALFVALKTGLIASVLVIPATYLCAVHFGWCWSKVVCLAKKGRGSK